MDRLSEIIRILRIEIGNPNPIIGNNDPFKVLISTVLSQRTRDENTYAASKSLFLKYDTPKKIADADIRDVENLIKRSGFYHVKAKRIKDISKDILENFNGQVPAGLDDLLTLPGVGRKTANCVLVYGFNIPAIPVDTHLHRIPNRIGIVNTKTPEQTEIELMKLVKKKDWLLINDLFVKFGQKICRPVRPGCSKCPIEKYCDYGAKVL